MTNIAEMFMVKCSGLIASNARKFTLKEKWQWFLFLAPGYCSLRMIWNKASASKKTWVVNEHLTKRSFELNQYCPIKYLEIKIWLQPPFWKYFIQ